MFVTNACDYSVFFDEVKCVVSIGCKIREGRLCHADSQDLGANMLVCQHVNEVTNGSLASLGARFGLSTQPLDLDGI